MKYVKKLMSVIFAVLFALFLSLPAFAADTASNITFVHQSSSAGKSKVAEIPAVYRVKERIDARSVGLEKTMGSITSLDCDPDGNVYALSGEGRIYRFDKDYNFTGTVETAKGSISAAPREFTLRPFPSCMSAIPRITVFSTVWIIRSDRK